MDPLQQVGMKIRLARVEAGLSQRELASRLQKKGPTISLWERGKISISILHLIEVAGILNKPLGYFMSGIEDLVIYRDSE